MRKNVIGLGFCIAIVLAGAAAQAMDRAERTALEALRRQYRQSLDGEWTALLFEGGVAAGAGQARIAGGSLEIATDGQAAEVLALAFDAATRSLTAGPSAAGLSVALRVDASGLEACGTFARGPLSGEIVLRRLVPRLEMLAAASIDMPAARVTVDLAAGEAPFAQAIKERVVAALTVTAEIPAVPVVLSKAKTAKALDSYDWYYLARSLQKGLVPGATFNQQKAVLVAAINEAIDRTRGAPTVIRDMQFASILLRRGVPFEGIMYLYVPIKDTLSHAHGEGVEFAIDPVHRSRMVSTKDVVAYMNSLDHGLLPTSYPAYFDGMHQFPTSEEAAYAGAVIDICLKGKVEPADLARLGPRARTCLTDFAGVLGAELYRVFIATPEPVVRGELIVPFAQNMIENTLLSLYTRHEPEIVVANVTTPSALPTASIDLLPEGAGSYWVAEHDFTPRLADRRLMQRLLTEWLRGVDGARLSELETLIGAKKKDLFQDLSVFFHVATRDHVSSGAAARAGELARGLLGTLLARSADARAFVARSVQAANAMYTARALPNFGDLWQQHNMRNLHAFWAKLTAAERRAMALGFDVHLRQRLNRDSVKNELQWYDRLTAQQSAAVAGADRHALAYVMKKLAWYAPSDAALLAEATARIENAAHPAHAATVTAAKALCDRLVARPAISRTIGMSAFISNELSTNFSTSWKSAAPDLVARGQAKILQVKSRLR